MGSRNPLIKFGAFGKVKKIITGFANKKLDPIEKNLIRGLFIRRIKDFNEEQKELLATRTLQERIS